MVVMPPAPSHLAGPVLLHWAPDLLALHFYVETAESKEMRPVMMETLIVEMVVAPPARSRWAGAAVGPNLQHVWPHVGIFALRVNLVMMAMHSMEMVALTARLMLASPALAQLVQFRFAQQ